MPTVVLAGTLDTKGHEYAFLRERVRGHGVDVLLVDVGVHRPQIEPDVGRAEVARAGGEDVEKLAAAGDRGAATEAMGRGAAALLLQLHEEGRLDGVLGIGGSGGSSVVTTGMRALPVGVPKLMVSTLASGDTRPYVGAVDVTMMYSVVDIAGVNSISARILTNAAGAIAGMVQATVPAMEHRPLIGASMFGVTTPGVTRARERLEELGYEVLVFHATGTGGQSMENLVAGGFLAGVLDLTTTELADDLVGGVLSAGPDRLEAAGAAGLPQVVSLGALDMVNFGPRESVPARFEGAQPLRAQPDGDADAHLAAGVPRARSPGGAQARRREGADGAVRAPQGRVDDRGGGASRSTTRQPTSSCWPGCRDPGRRRGAPARPRRQRRALRGGHGDRLHEMISESTRAPQENDEQLHPAGRRPP
jgi:uncharacterized protein (UPF0261 family)